MKFELFQSIYTPPDIYPYPSVQKKGPKLSWIPRFAWKAPLL